MEVRGDLIVLDERFFAVLFKSGSRHPELKNLEVIL